MIAEKYHLCDNKVLDLLPKKRYSRGYKYTYRHLGNPSPRVFIDGSKCEKVLKFLMASYSFFRRLQRKEVARGVHNVRD